MGTNFPRHVPTESRNTGAGGRGTLLTRSHLVPLLFQDLKLRIKEIPSFKEILKLPDSPYSYYFSKLMLSKT